MKLLLTSVLLVLFTTVSGCETLLGPQRAAATAETAEQRLELRGYAVERSFNILLEDALVIASAPTTNDNVRQSIQMASATGTQIVDELSDSLSAYAVERAKFEAGQSTIEQVTQAVESLESWISRADAALIALSAAIGR